MSFDQILEELPSFTVDERLVLLRRLLEIDESRLSPDQESVVEARLSKDKLDPATSVPASAMRERLQFHAARSDAHWKARTGST